jgi:hypothetical protein
MSNTCSSYNGHVLRHSDILLDFTRRVYTPCSLFLPWSNVHQLHVIRATIIILYEDTCVSDRDRASMFQTSLSFVCWFCTATRFLLFKRNNSNEFLPEGQTVNSDYYFWVFNRLWARILGIRPEYREQGSWSLLHDNAPLHNSKIVRDFLVRKGITVLDHLRIRQICSSRFSAVPKS